MEKITMVKHWIRPNRQETMASFFLQLESVPLQAVLYQFPFVVEKITNEINLANPFDLN